VGGRASSLISSSPSPFIAPSPIYLKDYYHPSLMSDKPLVLVTGGTGFLGAWVIVHLFRQGYNVRTTVRSLSRADGIKDQLRQAKISEDQISSLQVVQADLLKDDGWSEAMKDVTFVQHVASPFPSSPPKHENDLIRPARDGTLRVLRFARDAGSVSRIVVTSSFAAVGADFPEQRRKFGPPFTEEDWTDAESKTLAPYPKSKTLAERAAWDFIKREGGKLELAVINPVAIFGPVLGKDLSTSVHAVSELLEGSIPGIPRLNVAVIDVRDCADMHLRAMANPKAKGERFICIGEGGIWLEDVAKTLRENLGDKARNVPKFVLPNLLVRVVAIFLPIARLIVKDLDEEHRLSNEKAKDVLGWQWQYSTKEAIMASANSLIELGAVKI
jgi:dihydroflavonol-4-reductase